MYSPPPNTQIADIRAIAARVKAHGNCILVVDNTFMSAYFQRPLDLGADIEFASVTKYYNGRSCVVWGVFFFGFFWTQTLIN